MKAKYPVRQQIGWQEPKEIWPLQVQIFLQVLFSKIYASMPNRLWKKLSKPFMCIIKLLCRYTHDLDELAGNLELNGIDIPQEVMEATILTTYAWEARYPGVAEPVTEEEYKEAVAMASVVVRWAETIIRKP